MPSSLCCACGRSLKILRAVPARQRGKSVPNAGVLLLTKEVDETNNVTRKSVQTTWDCRVAHENTL